MLSTKTRKDGFLVRDILATDYHTVCTLLAYISILIRAFVFLTKEMLSFVHHGY